jgi:hypothetical protein
MRNKQARIDPWPSWLGTYLHLIPSHNSLQGQIYQLSLKQIHKRQLLNPIRISKLRAQLIRKMKMLRPTVNKSHEVQVQES